MAEHTPGPWTLQTVASSSGICHKVGPFPWKDGKLNHACIYADHPSNGPVEAELLANARLIAAAPDLLDALKGLLPRYRKLLIEAGYSEQFADQATFDDVAAIAKAEAQS